MRQFLRGFLPVLVLSMLLLGATAALADVPADPSGAATGTVNDIPAQTPGQPTPAEIADAVGHNRIAINIMWTLVTGFLVMFMQAGFALVETGFTRAKNASHTMLMNFMVYGIAMLAYWAIEFGLQAGGVGALGTLGGYDQLNHAFTVTIGGQTW